MPARGTDTLVLSDGRRPNFRARGRCGSGQIEQSPQLPQESGQPPPLTALRSAQAGPPTGPAFQAARLLLLPLP